MSFLVSSVRNEQKHLGKEQNSYINGGWPDSGNLIVSGPMILKEAPIPSKKPHKTYHLRNPIKPTYEVRMRDATHLTSRFCNNELSPNFNIMWSSLDFHQNLNVVSELMVWSTPYKKVFLIMVVRCSIDICKNCVMHWDKKFISLYS